MFRKIILFFVKPLFKITYYILKFLNLKIGYINISRFGEAIYEYYLLKNIIDKKNSIIFYQEPISSKFLLDIIFQEKKIFKLNIIVREFINYLVIHKYFSCLIENHFLNKDIYYNDVNKYPLIYSFTNSEKYHIKKFFFKNKLDIKKEFICIHNRDNRYLENLDRRLNFDYHNYRNFSINDFVKSLDYLTNKYLVIRTGIISNEKLNYNKNLILDMPFIKHSSLVSFYILSNCKFYIGSDSGAWTVAYLFKKPIFFINFSLTISQQQLTNCVNTSMIFKKIFSKDLNRYLKLSEIIDFNLFGLSSIDDLNKLNLEVHNNTEEEILTYIKEIRLVDSQISFLNDEHRELSNNFWYLIIKKLKLNLPRKKFPIIGYNFLKTNPNLLR